jgi:hypothetical protein
MFVPISVPDPYLRLGLPDPDPSIIKQKWYGKKTLYFHFIVTSLSVKNDVNVPSKRNEQKNLGKKIYGLASGRSLMNRAGSVSVRQRYGTEDSDPDQNVTNPEHWCQYK